MKKKKKKKSCGFRLPPEKRTTIAGVGVGGVRVATQKDKTQKMSRNKRRKKSIIKKAMAAADQVEEGIIIGADTVVSIDGKNS